MVLECFGSPVLAGLLAAFGSQEPIGHASARVIADLLRAEPPEGV